MVTKNTKIRAKLEDVKLYFEGTETVNVTDILKLTGGRPLEIIGKGYGIEIHLELSEQHLVDQSPAKTMQGAFTLELQEYPNTGEEE